MTHPTWQLPLNEQGSGLVLTPCPGTKGVELEASLQQLKAQGVSVVVTALNDEELHEKSVNDLGKQVQALGMKWFQLVIEDDRAPDANFALEWNAASPSIHAALKQGEKVAMHCMGGSGRTGLLAAHALLELNWPLDRIISEVQALRPGAFTKPVQVDYIKQVAGQ
ncbi:dual specificity protein phosphatase family protein [Vibrio rumoiensis]|uniref:Phosphatase n=1 Tax=Vibrio rumoiensis 1S-45 TaxID=1188252 RepID=A0A1E5E365_9VIBR|nr:dual specificity protein phosphatase family protein [Vibrio rumoiensis]OEF26107.1 phosphatase [Vibrio rumoiensis 1S-45]